MKFSCGEAITSPAATGVDALPQLRSQQPDVAIRLSAQSLGKAARGRIHEQHCAVCIAAAIAAGKNDGRGGL